GKTAAGCGGMVRRGTTLVDPAVPPSAPPAPGGGGAARRVGSTRGAPCCAVLTLTEAAGGVMVMPLRKASCAGLGAPVVIGGAGVATGGATTGAAGAGVPLHAAPRSARTCAGTRGVGPRG